MKPFIGMSGILLFNKFSHKVAGGGIRRLSPRVIKERVQVWRSLNKTAREEYGVHREAHLIHGTYIRWSLIKCFARIIENRSFRVKLPDLCRLLN